MFHICLEGFIKLIYVKDAGDSLTVLNCQDRICINVRLLKSFVAWLTENEVACENDLTVIGCYLEGARKYFI